MKGKQLPKIIRLWLGPNLPLEHIFVGPKEKQEGVLKLLRIYFYRWFIHPIKRRLAKYYLFLLKHFFGLKIVAITGSAGKTTTKEMVASILSLSGKTVFSYANIDPVYNIPTTILRCSPRVKYLVLEMGVEYPGEMDYYLWLAKPNLAAITNIYPTHTEFFGNIQGVFREKRKLVDFLSSNSFCVLNAEDESLLKLKNKLRAKIVWFGKTGQIVSKNIEINKNGKTYFSLLIKEKTNGQEKQIKIAIPILGSQFVENALAAAGLAYVLEIPLEVIKRGLEKFKPAKHRMFVLKHKSGAIILDDTYNNNPLAATAALKTLESVSKKSEKRVVVFGDMLELGQLEKEQHQLIGKKIAKLNPVKLVCIGRASLETAGSAAKLMGKNRVAVFSSWQDSVDEIKKELNPGTVMLIKASRSIGLDNLVSALL